VWHCLLVTGEGMEDGVLVESEGSSYARYSSFVPSVKEIMEQQKCGWYIGSNKCLCFAD